VIENSRLFTKIPLPVYACEWTHSVLAMVFDKNFGCDVYLGRNAHRVYLEVKETLTTGPGTVRYLCMLHGTKLLKH
jgi:hypothetical protein